MNKKVFKSTQNSPRKEALESAIKERMFSNDADDCVVIFENETCIVRVSKMYQGLGNLVSFSNMKWLSDLLGTEKINLQNESYSSGCESCDWGSSHSVDFICGDINV